MKKSFVKISWVVASVFFGSTLAEAVTFGNASPTSKRLREGNAQQRIEEAATRKEVMTPEEKQKWEERRARIKARFDRWLVTPVKQLRPHRHPGPPSREAAARRKERMDGRMERIIPRRYPEGSSTDPGASGSTSTNIQPVGFSEEKIK